MNKSSEKAQPDWLTGERSARKPVETMAKPMSETSEMTAAQPPEAASAPTSADDAKQGRATGWLAKVLNRAASGGAKKPSRTAGWSPAAVLAVAAVALLCVGFLWWSFFAETASHDANSTLDASGGASVETSPIRGTEIAFDGLEVEEDRARLTTSDGLVWEGSVAAGEEGETITLSGPTAAQIKRGFELPGSSVQSGTYAVAEPDGRVVHVTFNTFMAGGAEVTQGSIFAIESDRLVHSGFYRDEREPGSEELVRAYMPPGGENYHVSFTSPEGTPIPLLVGFEGLSEER
jgi:hypothetical protein